MQIFDDNIDSSINKLRAIFLQGFKVVKSTQLLSDKKALINEITNEILKLIEEYLVDINNVTIDLVCGRIENKLRNFNIYDILLDDDSLNEIKKCIDESVNVVNYIENKEVLESKENTIIEKDTSKKDYISPGQKITLTLSTIGFEEKLNELYGFFDENKKSTSSTSKNKKKKKDESVLSRLTGIFSFPLMILGRYKAPKWLTSDLVAPMFFDILENKIATNLEQNILKTVDIAKRAVLNNKKLLASFNTERTLNEKLASYNKKLAKENRSLAIDLITNKLKKVFIKIKNNIFNTFRNIKDSILTFVKIVFTTISMIFFIANLALRIISILFIYLFNIFILTVTFIANIAILLFYIVTVTAAFILASIFVSGIILTLGTTITSLFLIALAIITLTSIITAAIIVILGIATIAAISVITVIISAAVLIAAGLLSYLLLITTLTFSNIINALSFAINVTAAVLADIILKFASVVLMLISAITIPFGFIAVTTIAIFTFFALLMTKSLMKYMLFMLKASFIILSFAFLTISMMYAMALAALAFSLALLAASIIALGVTINLTALLVLLVLFGIATIIVYTISKLVKKLVNWLLNEFNEHLSTIDYIVFDFIDPVIGYILNLLEKALRNKNTLKELKQKFDKWINITPELIKNTIVNTIKETLTNIINFGYSFIKSKILEAIKLLNNVTNYIIEVINNKALNDFVYGISVVYALYRKGDENIRKIYDKIEKWHNKHINLINYYAMLEAEKTNNEFEKIRTERIKKIDGLAEIDSILNNVGKMSRIDIVKKLIVYVIGFAYPDMIFTIDKNVVDEKNEKIFDKDIKKFNFIVNEAKYENIDITEEYLNEIYNDSLNDNEANNKSSKILIKKDKRTIVVNQIENKIRLRTNILTLKSPEEENYALV